MDGLDDRSFDAEAALARLDDVLLGLPLDRLLPDIDDLFGRAKVPVELREDARVLDLVERALRERPWGDPRSLGRVDQQVSLLELEVEVLRARLAAATDPEQVDAVATSLRRVRAELDGLIDHL